MLNLKLVMIITLLTCQVLLSNQKYKTFEKQKLIHVYTGGEKGEKQIYEGKQFLYEFNGEKLVSKSNFDEFATVWTKENYIRTGEVHELMKKFKTNELPNSCKKMTKISCFESIVTGHEGKIGLNAGMVYLDLANLISYERKTKQKRMTEKNSIYTILDIMRLTQLVIKNIENPKGSVARVLKNSRLREKYKSDSAYRDEVRLTTGIQFQQAEEFLTKTTHSLNKLSSAIKNKLYLLKGKERDKVMNQITEYSKLDRDRILKDMEDYEAIIKQYEMQQSKPSEN